MENVELYVDREGGYDWNKLSKKLKVKEIKKRKNFMYFFMKIFYFFFSVYGRVRGGGCSVYCGIRGRVWGSYWIYFFCYVVDFSSNESKILVDFGNNYRKEM